MPIPGIDVKLRESPLAPGVADLQLDANGDIAHEDSWDTAIFVSLFTDARAEPHQVPVPERRRGWAGNERTPGQQMGSLLWLYEQPRLDRRTANSIEDAAENCLRWMVRDGYATSVRAIATLLDTTTLKLEIVIVYPDSPTETRLYELWNNTGKTFFKEVAA